MRSQTYQEIYVTHRTIITLVLSYNFTTVCPTRSKDLCPTAHGVVVTCCSLHMLMVTHSTLAYTYLCVAKVLITVDVPDLARQVPVAEIHPRAL